ncbi:MAG: LCP family protein [Bacillota bacterium]|nr:LCP family protein [Bacillota bacterium]
MTRSKKLSFRGIVFLLALAALLLFCYWLFFAGSLIPQRDADSGLIQSERALNVLIVGSDENPELGISGRADTIILAQVRLDEPSLFLLSLPRDTLVEIEGHGRDKLNHAYGGIELLRSTTEQLLNVPVDYYAVTDFNGFENIVDVLGGVEIEVDKRMYYQTYDGLIDIEAGLQTLNGEQALQYVRYRQDALGDITRVGRQQKFLKALVEKCTSSTGVFKLPQLLVEIGKMVETDLPGPYLFRLGLSMLSLQAENIESSTLPGDFVTIQGASYWQLEEDQLQELIQANFGENNDDE